MWTACNLLGSLTWAFGGLFKLMRWDYLQRSAVMTFYNSLFQTMNKSLSTAVEVAVM